MTKRGTKSPKAIKASSANVKRSGGTRLSVALTHDEFKEWSLASKINGFSHTQDFIRFIMRPEVHKTLKEISGRI